MIRTRSAPCPARSSAAALCAAAVLLLACGQDQRDAAPVPAFTAEAVSAARAAWPPEFTAALDSANDAYGAQQFERASALFHRAVQIAPDISAGWFGVYIAEHARGNVAAADSALRHARSLDGDAAPDTTAAAGGT